MHDILLKTALSEEGEGPPAKLYTNYRVVSVDADAGSVTFENGKTVVADMLIGSDGIRSAVRPAIGIQADVTPAPLAAYRCNIHAKTVDELGLVNLTASNGIDYWGGFRDGDRSQYFKIVLSGCRSGEILSFYLFMPVSDGQAVSALSQLLHKPLPFHSPSLTSFFAPSSLLSPHLHRPSSFHPLPARALATAKGGLQIRRSSHRGAHRALSRSRPTRG